MSDPVNLTVFSLIVLSRLFLPLLIPRYPLPAILVALVLDGIDGGLLANFSTMSLDTYQRFDKALDVYYLTIAYLSTLRNWVNPDAITIGRFLLYYRLVGVLLFELSDERWMMFVFPNTFEYFFIFYELLRLRWDPGRMSRRMLIFAVAAIWIVIKLPQEYWIHIAQRDLSDTLMEYPILILFLAVIAIGLVPGVRWLLLNRFPPADHPMSFDMGHPVASEKLAGTLHQYLSLDWRSQRIPEKIALVSLVAVIFTEMLPQTNLGALEQAIGVAIVVIANTAVTEWISHRRSIWFGLVGQFLVMALINVGIMWLIVILLPGPQMPFLLANFVFLLYLISLLIMLFDLFMSIYQAREHDADASHAKSG